jgi:predicted AAA+ superfamily ATPase
MSYMPRIIDSQIETLLNITGALIIEGPRAVGKTESSMQFATSFVNLALNESARELAKMGSRLVLEGSTPRLIDEWQVVGGIWDLIKVEIDNRGRDGLRGQFILTGSSSPQYGVFRSTMAGRVSRLKMRPMSLFESGHSNGSVSLAGLFSGEKPYAADQGLDLRTIIERICIGGWPIFASQTETAAREGMTSYLIDVSRMDIQQASGISHDPTNVMKVLRSLSRNVGTRTPISTITADASGVGESIHRTTVAAYISALEQLMIVEDLPAWGPHIRSKSTMRAAPTRYFVDPALAVASINTNSSELIRDLKATGFLFENLVIRDLRIYAETFRGRLSQYKDSDNTEVDVIIQGDNDGWAAIEIKLGVNQIDAAAKKLIAFKEKIDTAKSGNPVFLAVITATGYGYERSDGVFVLPIGLLGP